VTKDNDALDEEWDRMPHSSDEYRKEIRELRGRIFTYVEEIAKLRSKIDLLQVEVSALEKMIFKQDRET
jgi:hypothetical protein